MSRPLIFVLLASLSGLILGVAYADIVRRRPRRFLPTMLLAAAATGVFVFALPRDIETKGTLDETVPVMFCYLAMLLGMFAEYGYAQAERGDKRLTFEPMNFLMPVFASPIVFIPLLTITADMALGGNFTKSKLMVYLVAFQNGFFWKSFFEQRRQKALEGAAFLPQHPRPPVVPDSLTTMVQERERPVGSHGDRPRPAREELPHAVSLAGQA